MPTYAMVSTGVEGGVAGGVGAAPDGSEHVTFYVEVDDLAGALQQIEGSYEDTLEALGAAIDLRDSETAGHSQRVCRYSLVIARAMSWSDKQLGSLARGAYLHDIGKLGIPDGILLEAGTFDCR